MSKVAIIPPSRSSATIRYDEMCSAIAAAYEVDEVKHIRDKALAIEVYAKQAMNVEAERQACEIRLRAERRTGQLLGEREKAKGGGDQRSDHPSPPVSGAPKPLAELGISHNQSSNWQKLAAVPEETFEETLKAPGKKPSTNGIIAAHAPPKPKSPVSYVDPRALWLWGRLQDFEREDLLSADPNELIATMLEHMKATTLDFVPRVIAWLGRIKP
jgi:hypothetical protein